MDYLSYEWPDFVLSSQQIKIASVKNTKVKQKKKNQWGSLLCFSSLFQNLEWDTHKHTKQKYKHTHTHTHTVSAGL